MSRETRRRARAGFRSSKRKFLGWMVPLILVVAILCGWVWKQKDQRGCFPTSGATNSAFTPPKTYLDLCALNSNDLAKCDIALVNLLCAEGLPGAEGLDVERCIQTLDNVAKSVAREIERYQYKYREHPEEFNHHEGFYRMMMMVTVLQQDVGIHYSPDRVSLPGQQMESNQKFFADSKDVLIHGLIRERGTGTCSSMPVFLVAVGRRLGYPLKLVAAKGHLFARWEQDDRSFNIEATSLGFVSHPDTYYRTWPAPFSAEEEDTEGYLKSMTPMRELAVFLSIRGECLRSAGNYKKALGAFAQAAQKDSRSVGCQKLFARSEWEAAQAGVLPKRQALLVELRHLPIPDGPRRVFFSQEKARIEAHLRAGRPEEEVEIDLEALRAEILSGLP